MSPSPPPGITAASGHLRPQAIRVHRLQLSPASSEHLSDYCRADCFAGTGTQAGDTGPNPQRVQQMRRTDVPRLPQAAHVPRPSLTNGEGAMALRYGMPTITIITMCICRK